MIYAVNKRTKEHYEVPYFSYMESSDWRYVKADVEGWIPWRCRPEAESPLPPGSKCDIRHIDGFEAPHCCADKERWSGVDAPATCTIIAYRPTLENETTKEKEPEQFHVGEQALWQDAEGTIPSRDGDPVGRIDCDMTGNVMQSSGSGRPVYREPEAPEWDGVGLPPSGAVIEAHDDYTQWQKCRVVAVEGAQLWLDYADDGYATCDARDVQMRPIRSAEDRAVDALSRAMKDAHDEGIDILEDRACCRVVYRAIRDGKIPGVKLTGGE